MAKRAATETENDDGSLAIAVKCRKTIMEGHDEDRVGADQISEKIDLERMIRLVHSNRCLWDALAGDFGQSEPVNTAWTRIADQMTIEVADVRSLWNSVWTACTSAQRCTRDFAADNTVMDNGTETTVMVAGNVGNWSELLANAGRITAITSKHGNKHFLNRRYMVTELLQNNDQQRQQMCSATDQIMEENVMIRLLQGVHQRVEEVRQVLREILFARIIQHKHFVPLVNAFAVEDDVYLVHQLLDGDLSQVISDGLDHFTISRLMHQLLLGIAQLHRAKAVHQALCPEVIAVNADASLKIQGFGRDRVSSVNAYSAPEQQMLNGSSPCDSKCDIWSIGCIFAEFFLHSRLFPNGNSEKFNGDANNNSEKSNGSSEKSNGDANNNDIRMKTFDRNLDEILPDSIFPVDMPEFGFTARNAKDLLNMMLRLTPSERISAEEALAHPYLSRWRSQQLLYPIDLEAVAECEQLLAIERTPEQWRALLREEMDRFAASNDVFGDELIEEDSF